MDNGAAQAPSNKLLSDDDIFSAELPDATLEAAAQAIPGAAMSFPNAPTVSILVICCNID